ncbi:MAG: Lrp/AsnC ligand binding domain-containing protein [Proteobacteria bacterium]|nr:Lrp/AsnC ligand binding domain-containing protein [Pseudomonadota bacterium]
MRPMFVMIKCELGRAYDVAERLIDEIETTSEVHSISGQYDLLAKFYLDEATDIGHFVCNEVQRVSGIKETFTLQAFKAFTA